VHGSLSRCKSTYGKISLAVVLMGSILGSGTKGKDRHDFAT
jgi:hypothetical protein